jgi:hypothetical protein
MVQSELLRESASMEEEPSSEKFYEFNFLLDKPRCSRSGRATLRRNRRAETQVVPVASAAPGVLAARLTDRMNSTR